MNCEICFFHRCSYKNSCCDKLVYNSSVVFMMFFRCFYLKNVALNFVLLVLKSCCYSAQPIHGDLQQLSLTLSVRSQSLKLKVGNIILRYPTQLVTTENPANSYLTSTVDKTRYGPVTASFSVQFLHIFCWFDVFPVPPPQKFQIQAKMSTKRPVFPDHLSVSYDQDSVKIENVRDNKSDSRGRAFDIVISNGRNALW